MPVQAESNFDPKFEQQVLQVLRKNPQAIIDSVQAYQREQQQAQQKVQQAFLQDLKQNPQSVIAQSATKGTGKAVLIEFSDFQCPYCQAAAGTVKQFVEKNSDRVTLVYKHLPLTSIHDQALPASKAAWAAQQQGKFWQYHDALFAQQKQLSEAIYPEIAKTVGLDLAKFNRDRASQAAQTAIDKDLQLAEQLGISGTPFFAMNGQAFPGAVDLATLEKNLNQAQ
ncbi:MAG: DsbA family protein [Leptolyngbya sp. Prado105]|nr:DsbA family protein [Leptolyngbya sp. Prado105]